MTTPPDRAALPRVRRSNDARSAETQARLIEATVDCLNRYGYAGATTIRVSETSGVARGGMLHHFPSKVDLMIGAAMACVDAMRDERRARQGARTHIVLEVERSRYGVALAEIMLGSRSDPALAERFKPVGALILERQRAAARHMAEREGVKDAAELEAVVWLTMAAVRGMTLMELAGVDPGLTDKALRLLGRASQGAIERQKAKEAGAKP